MFSVSAGAQTITFVQQNNATPQQAMATVSVTYTAAQTAGNLNVVVVGWNDATSQVQSVSDTRGNVYQLAVGPTVRAGSATQSIYYAPNIAAASAGGNAVTVNFSPAANDPDVRIAEYRGLATVNPVDVTAAAQGSGTSANSGSVTTTIANDLLVGANIVQTHATGPGTSYTQRVITKPDGDILEDRVVTAVGSYNATAPMTSGWWVMQMVAFRAAAADATPPSAPGTPVLSVISGSQINLTWPVATDNVGVTGYRVERCAGTGCSSFAQVGTPATNSFNDAGLTGATSYTYRVRATDAAGNLGPYSNTATAATSDGQPPSAPGTPVPSVISTTQINVTWPVATDNVAVTGYLLERCSGAGCGSFAQIAAPVTNSFNDTGLSPSTSYSYRVRATDAANNVGPYSSTATATTQSAPDTQPPAAPGTPILTVASSSRITLSWSAATDDVGVAGYLLERCSGPGCSSFAQIAAPATASFSDTGLSPSTSYSYRVRANDAAGNLGPYSATATALSADDTQPPAAPGTPVLTVVSTSQINLTWAAATDDVAVTGYLLERCSGAGCSTFAQIGTPAVPSFSDTGLSPSTNYSYRVRATDAAGNLGAYSATAAATTPAPPDTQPPTAPGTPVLTLVSSSQITVTWAAASDDVGVTGYFLERCAGEGCSSFAQVGSQATTTFNDSGLSASTSYSYRVRAADAANNVGSYSAIGSATTSALPPDLTIAKTHQGSFNPGQVGATYSLTVSNIGPGPTAGVVTLNDALPPGLTATAFNGAGWSCSLSPLSCTRGDVLAAGASYPVVTLTVNVSSTAPASVTNTATVSGGGETNTANDGASDVTAIGSSVSPPVFVAEGHFAVDQNTTGLNRATLSLNGSGPNRVLLAALHVEFDGGDSNWVATDNGTPGTLLVMTDGYTGGAGNNRFQIFYWINPPSGTNNVVIQNTYSGSNEISASAVLLSNVNQSSPFGAITIDTSTKGRTSESETVASTLSDLVMHVIGDAYFNRGILGDGETSVSIANDGLQKSSPGDGDASLWLSTKPGGFPTTTVSSSGWPSSPAPAPRPMTGVAIAVHSAGADAQAPTTPGNLAAASSGAQVNASWTPSSDNVGVIAYMVERCQGAGCSNYAQVAAASPTTYQDTAVAMGSSYTYRVRATDAAGNVSSYSNSSTAVVPDTLAPSAPANLAPSTTTSSQIALIWSPASDNLGVAGYRVIRNGTQVGTTSQTTFVDAGLATGTTYSYVVLAFDAAGNTSAPSNTATVSTVSLAPATPTLVQHVAGGMDNQFATTLTLSLPQPSGAGNALVLGVRFNAAGSIAAVADNLGNAWLTGSTVANVSGSIGTRMALFYALNVAAGTQTITVTFNGLGGPGGAKAFPQAVVSEFCNIAAVSALDGQSANGASATPGTITTSSAGDLIYEWGVVVSNVDANTGAQFNGTGIAGGSGFTLLSADLQTGSTDQYRVQPAAGPITPSFSPSGSETWASLAMALRAAPAGTPSPAGIRIVHVQHSMVSWPEHPAAVTLAFPSTGNLLIASFAGDTPSIAGVTDSGNNTWLSAGVVLDGTATSAQIQFAPGAATSPNLNALTLNLTAPCNSTGCSVVLYDVAGATASPFDTSSLAAGTQAGQGMLTMASLTPTTANELVVAAGAVSAHTVNATSGGGLVLDSHVNAFDDQGPSGTTASRLDSDDAFAHVTTGAAAPVTFSFGATTQTPGGAGSWSAVAAAFYGVVPPADSTAPSVPLSLVGTGVSPTQINLAWTASTDDVGVIGYRVYRNGTLVGTSAATGFADSGLSVQTSYTYAVSAFDAAGNVSPLTAPATASTTFGDVAPPTVPANLQSSNVTSASLTLTWSGSSDDTGVAGYRVFRNGALATTTSATSFSDAGLQASTTYSYSVLAFDAAGNASASSTPLNVTTAAAPPVTFVKLKETRSTAATTTISTGAFTSAVSNGNLLVVWIWYAGSAQSVSSVTDTAGNSYAIAAGPTTGAGAMAGFRQEIWYAKNVVGGSNLNVTATFAGASSTEKSITAHEYSGLDAVAPLDGAASATTTSANASTGAVTTRFARELIFGAAVFQGSGSAGTGFTRRSSIVSNASEDKVVSATGSYAATFTNTAQAAIVQVVAFKATGQ